MFDRRSFFGAACVVFLFSAAALGAPVTYLGTLNGANENPPNSSTGTGTTTVTYDAATHLLGVSVTFSGLSGTTTAAHIHCCVVPNGNVGVATTTPTFAGFPLGVTAGTYNNTLDLTQASSFNPSFVTANGGTLAGAEAALVNGLAAGQSYLNIHTNVHAGGEIRSFLYAALSSPSAVPALSGRSLALLAGFLAAGGAYGLRRMSK